MGNPHFREDRTLTQNRIEIEQALGRLRKQESFLKNFFEELSDFISSELIFSPIRWETYKEQSVNRKSKPFVDKVKRSSLRWSVAKAKKLFKEAMQIERIERIDKSELRKLLRQWKKDNKKRSGVLTYRLQRKITNQTFALEELFQSALYYFIRGFRSPVDAPIHPASYLGDIFRRIAAIADEEIKETETLIDELEQRLAAIKEQEQKVA